MPFFEEGLPKVHARELVCHDAEIEFGAFWSDLAGKHNLTHAEQFRILLSRLHLMAGSCVSIERDNADKRQRADEKRVAKK